MRKFWAYFTIKWQEVLQYRADMVMYAVANSVSPIVGLFLWSSLQATGVELKLNYIQLLQYFLVAFVVTNMTASWVSWWLSQQIKNGVFSNYLLKPLPVGLVFFTDIFAQKSFRILILVPTIIVLGSFLIGWQNLLANISLSSFILFLISLTFAMFINFYIDMIIGLSSVWLHEISFINGLMYLSGFLLSGQLIPIIFLPDLLYQISILLPFRYIVSFPIEILLGLARGEVMVLGFTIQIIWFLSLFLIYRIVSFNAQKSYEGYGL